MSQSTAQPRRRVALAVDRFGTLDILVNNAGRIVYKELCGNDARRHGTKAPIGRAVQPPGIAEIVAFLASDRASFIVGSVVMADGGMSVLSTDLERRSRTFAGPHLANEKYDAFQKERLSTDQGPGASRNRPHRPRDLPSRAPLKHYDDGLAHNDGIHARAFRLLHLGGQSQLSGHP